MVPKIRMAVDAWRAGGYQGASDVTRRLFEYWFDEDHEVAGFLTPFRYYFCQREAIETLVWLVEIAGQRRAEADQALRDDLPEGPPLEEHRVPDHDGRPAAAPSLRAGAGRSGSKTCRLRTCAASPSRWPPARARPG